MGSLKYSKRQLFFIYIGWIFIHILLWRYSGFHRSDAYLLGFNTFSGLKRHYDWTEFFISSVFPVITYFFMTIKKWTYIKKVVVQVIYVMWAALNLYPLYKGLTSRANFYHTSNRVNFDNNEFWPFTEYHHTFCYGFFEYFVYVGTPLAIFWIHFYMNKRKNPRFKF